MRLVSVLNGNAFILGYTAFCVPAGDTVWSILLVFLWLLLVSVSVDFQILDALFLVESFFEITESTKGCFRK